MRTLLDQVSGEMVEVLETDVKGLEPYDYREAKAAAFRCSLERRAAVQEYKNHISRLALAEKNYRRELAAAVVAAKLNGPATTAEIRAKGMPEVLQAREEYTLADGMRYAALEVIRTCDGDAQRVMQLTAWSRDVAKGPWGDQ